MKALFLALGAGALVACSKDPTQPSEPVPSTVVVTSPQSVIVVNSQVQLTATVYDQKGKAIQGLAVQWQSLQPQIASVSTSGLVTGVAEGSVTIQATAGGKSGEATLTVDPDPCTTPLALQVGQVRQLSGPAAVACVSLASTTGPTDFLFITANGSQSLDDLAFYSVNLSQAGAATSLATSWADLDPRVMVEREAMEFRGAVEGRIREQERALLPKLAPMRRAAMLSLGVDAAPSIASAVQGDTIVYHVPNVLANNLCTTYTDIRAVVKKVSQHALIVQDVNAPAGGFTQQDFDDVAAEFENVTYPTDTLYFGGETDRNADGHVTILYTAEVNRATSQGAAGFIAGFFWGGDLVKKSEYAGLTPPVPCPQTNEQEIFYMLVPDPSGTINGNVRSVATVRQNTRGTIAHEFQHMINQGIRLLNPAVDSSETVWLNEALSHMAEEVVGRALRGFGDFQNLGFSDVNPNPTSPEDYNAFFRQNLLRLRPWMQRPDTASPISNKSRNQLAPRGAGWMFLRYLMDHFSNNNAKAYLRHLVAGPDIGVRNLLQWSNGALFDDMVSGFLISQFTDEFGVSGLAARYSMPSWRVRNVMEGANNGVFPLLVSALPASISTQSLSSSGNYFRLTRSGASPVTTFRMLAPGGTPVTFPGARVYVVRLN